jgi:alkylhydroperoxidase/carboxymuconolactone decarboxylase family protein YurZ
MSQAAGLRLEFERTHGYWNESYQRLLDDDPVFFETFLRFSATPVESGRLDPKLRELVLVAVNASTTHLHEPALRIHIRQALLAGATREEIVEVFQLTTTIGIHALAVGVPALLGEAEAAGRKSELPSGKLSEELSRLKEKFIASRGYWTPFWEQVLQLDARLFEAYADLSSVPWRNGPLSPKVKELIYIAIDAATTHLFEPGIRVHMKNALQHGATVREIMDVLALVSVLGIHTCTVGLPILAQEWEKLDRAGGAATD